MKQCSRFNAQINLNSTECCQWLQKSTLNNFLINVDNYSLMVLLQAPNQHRTKQNTPPSNTNRIIAL